MNYPAFKKAFFDKFQPQEDPEVAIRSAIDLSLQDDDVISFLKKAESLYSAADFNDSAKLVLLRKYIQGHPELIQFVMFRSSTTYNELVEATVSKCLIVTENNSSLPVILRSRIYHHRLPFWVPKQPEPP